MNIAVLRILIALILGPRRDGHEAADMSACESESGSSERCGSLVMGLSDESVGRERVCHDEKVS